MQIMIRNRLDLFKAYKNKEELYKEGSKVILCAVDTIDEIELDKSYDLICTQDFVDSDIVEKYILNKQYIYREVEVLSYKGSYYLLDGHHTYTAWVLDGRPNKLQAKLVEFNQPID